MPCTVQLSGRRKLVLALGAGALAPPIIYAADKPGKVWRIGFMGTDTAAGYAKQIEAMRDGLREYGFIEGKNLVIDYGWANGQRDLYPQIVADQIRRKVDVLVTHGIVLPRMAQEANNEIPIVIASMGSDPVEDGLVASLPRPGGNITGRTSLSIMMHVKQMELIKEIFPKARRVAVLRRASSQLGTSMQRIETAARKLDLDVKLVTIDRVEEFNAALSSMKEPRIDAFIVWNSALFVANARRLAELAIKHRIPMLGNQEFAETGALLGYGASILDNFRRVGYFVDRIAKGANPATMPIEQPTTFELVLNMKTAKTLGITFPPSVLVRAERVIQ